jgi:hypothetical protein
MRTPDADFSIDLRELVPRRETCEKLDEHGFDMVTHFFWDYDRILRAKRGYQPTPGGARWPAPTAAELGQVLPLRIMHERVKYFLEVEGVTAFYASSDSMKLFAHSAQTEAEVRAQLWLRLESEGLLSEDNTA